MKRALVVMVGLLFLAGCPDDKGGPTEPEVPEPTMPQSLRDAIAEGDADAVKREVKESGGLDTQTHLKLTLQELRKDRDVGEWLKIYLKYKQLMNAAVYSYLPFMCKGSSDKLKDDLGALFDAVREDPRKLLERDSYALIKGLTPLHLAALFCHDDVAAALIEAGANVEAKDALGLTPLHYASCASITKLLLDKGADVNAKSTSGLTPLHLALDRKIARALILRGAVVNARDACGNTPLHLAASNGLDMRSSRNRPPSGKTFSTTAPAAEAEAKGEEAPVAAWLVRLGFQIDQGLRELLESFDVAGELLDQGANPGITNDAGKTPDDVYAEMRSSSSDWDD